MTSIADALKAAGIPTPNIKQRIWSYVKDNPGRSATQIAKDLKGISIGSISSSLSNMETRGMVYTKQGVGTSGRGRTPKTYYTDLPAYALLPLPEDMRASSPAPETPPSAPAPAKAPSPAPAVTQETAAVFVDSLTVKEARALYEYLKGMFA